MAPTTCKQPDKAAIKASNKAQTSAEPAVKKVCVNNASKAGKTVSLVTVDIRHVQCVPASTCPLQMHRPYSHQLVLSTPLHKEQGHASALSCICGWCSSICGCCGFSVHGCCGFSVCCCCGFSGCCDCCHGSVPYCFDLPCTSQSRSRSFAAYGSCFRAMAAMMNTTIGSNEAEQRVVTNNVTSLSGLYNCQRTKAFNTFSAVLAGNTDLSFLVKEVFSKNDPTKLTLHLCDLLIGTLPMDHNAVNISFALSLKTGTPPNPSRLVWSE